MISLASSSRIIFVYVISYTVAKKTVSGMVPHDCSVELASEIDDFWK